MNGDHLMGHDGTAKGLAKGGSGSSQPRTESRTERRARERRELKAQKQQAKKPKAGGGSSGVGGGGGGGGGALVVTGGGGVPLSRDILPKGYAEGGFGAKMQEANGLYRVGGFKACRAAKALLQECADLPHARKQEGHRLEGLGDVCQSMGETASALEAYTAALAVARETGDAKTEKDCVESLGRLKLQLSTPGGAVPIVSMPPRQSPAPDETGEKGSFARFAAMLRGDQAAAAADGKGGGEGGAGGSLEYEEGKNYGDANPLNGVQIAPVCPRNHDMVWSDSTEGYPRDSSWHCDICEETVGPGWRWWCRGCQCDVCAQCKKDKFASAGINEEEIIQEQARTFVVTADQVPQMLERYGLSRAGGAAEQVARLTDYISGLTGAKSGGGGEGELEVQLLPSADGSSGPSRGGAELEPEPEPQGVSGRVGEGAKVTLGSAPQDYQPTIAEMRAEMRKETPEMRAELLSTPLQGSPLAGELPQE